jgi:hypothetical protein
MSGTAHQCCLPSRPAPLRANAAAARSLAAATLVLLTLLAGSPALGQQLGDFGRLEPGVVNDELIPLVDKNRRGMNGKPLDGFNLTDEEVEMRDRVWRFLVAPHAKDWAWPYSAEIRQAKAGGLTEKQVGKYYRWLTSQRYASSRVRFNTITDHVRADIGTLPATFRSVCAVLEVDRQRAVSVAEIDYLEPEMAARQRKRDRENGAFIERFVLALGFRYDSYQYALDHFLVETPHREAVAVDTALSELAPWVERANARDFCGDAWSGYAEGDSALPGRLLLDPPDEGPYRK